MLRKFSLLCLFVLLMYGTGEAALIESYDIHTHEGFSAQAPGDSAFDYVLFSDLTPQGYFSTTFTLPTDDPVALHWQEMDSASYQQAVTLLTNGVDTDIHFGSASLAGWADSTLTTTTIVDLSGYSISDIVISGLSVSLKETGGIFGEEGAYFIHGEAIISFYGDPAPVPEPSTVVLLGGGLILSFWFGRRSQYPLI